MSITTHVLLSLLVILSPSGESVRDLCDLVDDTTGAPLVCQPHGEGAPVYDSTVCCERGTCFAAPDGYCLDGEDLFYCELGEVRTTEEVICYFEVPDYCDVFTCEPPSPDFSWHPQEESICCEHGICTPYVKGYCEEQNIYMCGSLVCNPDGTVTCIDWEE